MKILFVSDNYHPADPPFNGDSQRTRLLYEACKRFAQVDVISFAGQPNQAKYPGKLKKWIALLPFKSVASLCPIDACKEAVVDKAVRDGEYDYIVTRYFFRAVLCGLWKYRDRLVVDCDDALPFFFLNQISPSSALTSRVRLNWAALKMRLHTRHIVRQLHASFFANEDTAKKSRIVFLPNIPFYMDSCRDADMNAPVKRILFVGQLEYWPNEEGLSHFLEHIYKPLRERLTRVEMRVVGLVKDEALRQYWQSFPEVMVMGFVEDLKQEYEQSHVVVVPIYRCGGTNIKLLEAMALNRACVTTAEAYGKMNGRFVAGKDLCVADNDQQFVDMLLTLLTDEKKNQSIAHHGKSVMEQYYSFDAFCEIVQSAIVKK
ncbi:MAG: glycosyltransferase family 4 protein [Bacteroidales bacterium]|nr:glycosyltransferase family 4 protein [Bacteroidales bacterium]